MASIESRLFHLLLRLIRKKHFLNMQFSVGKFGFYRCPSPPKEIRSMCNVTQTRINGHKVFTMKPKTNCSDKYILYLHGGAYVQSFVLQHWSFLGMLVENLNCTIIAPDYPLAPQHTYEDSFAMAVPLYKELLIGSKPSDLIFMGDSAGGGFALALAQKIKSENLPQPGQIILLSPWLDITLKNPEINAIDPNDPFLGISGLRKAGKAYAGNTSPDNYLLSPIFGSVESLGKISLFIGSWDILAADARKFVLIARSKGITINYFEYDQMLHIWMLMNFPESRKAKEQIIELIRNP